VKSFKGSKSINIAKYVCMLTIFIFVFAGGVYANDAPIVLGLTVPDPACNITLTSTDGDYGSAYNGAIAFKRIVEEETNGNIQVKIYPNCQLGGEREQLEATRIGAVQAAFISTLVFPVYLKDYMAFTIPYMIPSASVMYKVLEGPIGKEFEEKWLEKTGVRILGWSQLGFRNFTNDTHPIHSPKDMKGMKIRVAESPDMVKLVESLGANSTTISYSELYTALQQGVADGEENAFNIFMTAKLYEVQKYIIVDKHRFCMNPFLINEKFYRSLSPEYRCIVKEAAITSCAVYRGLVEFGNTLWIDDLKKRGLEIYYPTVKELEQFHEASKPVEDYIRSQVGNKWVDKVKNAVKKSEESIYD